MRGLELKSAGEWRDYNKSGMRPDDIPIAPHYIYANDGWAGWSDWLEASAVATYLSRYRSLKTARAFVRGLGLNSLAKWQAYCKSALPNVLNLMDALRRSGQDEKTPQIRSKPGRKRVARRAEKPLPMQGKAASKKAARSSTQRKKASELPSAFYASQSDP